MSHQMNRLVYAVLAFFSSGLLFGQATDQQLRELRIMSSVDILDCAFHFDSQTCKYSEWELSNELGRRGNVKFLTRSYRQADAGQREVIILAMMRIKHNPEVTAFMRRVSFKQFWPDKLDTEPRWYALQYLAEACDDEGLQRLNGEHNFRGSYPVACMDWVRTIRAFGKCKYRPAVAHLIRSTNSVACLGISDAAIESLQELFPGKCSGARSYNQAHDCFQKAASQAEVNGVSGER